MSCSSTEGVYTDSSLPFFRTLVEQYGISYVTSENAHTVAPQELVGLQAFFLALALITAGIIEFVFLRRMIRSLMVLVPPLFFITWDIVN